LDNSETEVRPLTRWNRHTDYIQSLALTQDFLFSGGQDGLLCRWSLLEERPETVLSMPGKSIWSLGIDETGQLIGLSFVHKVAKIYDLRSTGDLIELKGHSDYVRTIVIDPSGRIALTGSSDHQLKMWDIGMKRCIHTFDCHSDSVYSLQPSSSFSHV
jgi:WD40 repeat protein